jgi:hypothetical protein
MKFKEEGLQSICELNLIALVSQIITGYELLTFLRANVKNEHDLRPSVQFDVMVGLCYRLRMWEEAVEEVDSYFKKNYNKALSFSEEIVNEFEERNYIPF